MWLEKNCSRKAIVRALSSEGETELLGGFKPILPTVQPGWIVKITSEHNKVWNVAIIAYQNRYGIRILEEVPWKNWIGDFPGESNLMNGDFPAKYWELKHMNKFLTCHTVQDKLKINLLNTEFFPIVWNRDGEFCIIPITILKNASDNLDAYNKLSSGKTVNPMVYIHWDQGIPISNEAGRALTGE